LQGRSRSGTHWCRLQRPCRWTAAHPGRPACRRHRTKGRRRRRRPQRRVGSVRCAGPAEVRGSSRQLGARPGGAGGGGALLAGGAFGTKPGATSTALALGPHWQSATHTGRTAPGTCWQGGVLHTAGTLGLLQGLLAVRDSAVTPGLRWQGETHRAHTAAALGPEPTAEELPGPPRRDRKGRRRRGGAGRRRGLRARVLAAGAGGGAQ